MNDVGYLGVIASVVESLAFLMPTGDADGDPAAWAVQVQVQWTGPDGSRGRIIVALDQGAAEATASNLMGLTPGELPAANDLQEACGELANVIAGNLLPVRYGADHEFHLHPPQAVTIAPLVGRTVLRLALVEGVLGVAIDGEVDNSRILRAVRVPMEPHA
jgi:hypothetical protein